MKCVDTQQKGENVGHQVIITFDIDENKVQANAEKEAGRQIAKEVIDTVFERPYNRDSLMRQYVKEIIRDMLEPNKEDIIEAAIQEVVGNLHRTKAVKEMLAKAVDE